jgi:serine/threonine-protein kinase
MSLGSGVLLSNRFTLGELIGTGGMSQVWRAEDAVLGRPVAVKVLTAALATDPTLRGATWTEARSAARLAHPHVTQVYDYGETALPDGSVLPYLVMELVDGQSLADRLRSGPLPWPQAVTMAAEVASALAAAHRIGVVHRDVKPGNVLLTRTGVKVCDFGIAALAGGQPAADGGRLVGTPAYAAPERLRSGPATPAIDVYALGVLLYEALTGHPPIAVTTWPQAATAHQSGAPVTPPEVAGLPSQVRRLCLACLSPDPAARPTAEELEHGLAAAAGQPSTATVTMPTMVGEHPAVAPGRRAGYAVGSAPLPHPLTMIDPGTSALDGEPPASSAPRMPRSLLAVLIAAVVVLAATVFLVAASLLSDGARQAAPPATSATATTQPPATPSAASSAPIPTATTARAIVDQFDATITGALAAGRINADAANSLRDKIKDLRESRSDNDNKVGKKARELQKRINELRADAKIDQQTADQLITLLQPLTGVG